MTSRFANVILCWISFYVVLLYTAVWCHCISYQSRLYLRCSASWQITAGRSLYKHELIEDKFFPHSIVLGKYSTTTIHSYIQLDWPVVTLRQFCSVQGGSFALIVSGTPLKSGILVWKSISRSIFAIFRDLLHHNLAWRSGVKIQLWSPPEFSSFQTKYLPGPFSTT